MKNSDSLGNELVVGHRIIIVIGSQFLHVLSNEISQCYLTSYGHIKPFIQFSLLAEQSEGNKIIFRVLSFFQKRKWLLNHIKHCRGKI